jgi:hypothetical protein
MHGLSKRLYGSRQRGRHLRHSQAALAPITARHGQKSATKPVGALLFPGSGDKQKRLTEFAVLRQCRCWRRLGLTPNTRFR